MSIDLKKLAEPFPAGDIEWRVSRAGLNKNGSAFCMVLAYITARAIANRLDAVCGPENWCNTPQEIKEVRVGVYSVQVGISIRIGDAWVTKYDVSEPTNIEPAKGGFSGAMKRAGAQWGIGRYLYLLDETFAETSENGGKGWEYARLPEKQGGNIYYWKPPQLPSWATPFDKDSDAEAPVTDTEVASLKRKWMQKFAPKERSKDKLSSGFSQFVFSIVGEFPCHDVTCWTNAIAKQVSERIASTTNANGPDSSVPFG